VQILTPGPGPFVDPGRIKGGKGDYRSTYDCDDQQPGPSWDPQGPIGELTEGKRRRILEFGHLYIAELTLSMND
jgi:hypothetical protein